MDAISLLKKDHRLVESLFKQFERLGDGSAREKKALVQQIIRELSVHAAVEEEIFYPAIRNAIKDEKDEVLEALEEHHVVKVLLSELSSLNPTHERYDAKVSVLKESVMHHVEEEETVLMPALQKKVDKQVLNDLGKTIEAAKKMAPTRPHPNAPDTPPGNLLAGIPAAMLDKVRDLVSGVASRGQQRRMTMTKGNGMTMARTGRSATSKSRNGGSRTGSRSTTSRTSSRAGSRSSSARAH